MTNYQSLDFAESVSTLRVIEIDSQTDPRWEAFVSTSPRGLIYHHPAWLQVLQEAYGYKPAHIACEDANGQLRGILPLFSMRGLLSGHRLSSLPRTPVAGPLAHNDEAMAFLMQAAVERVRDKQGKQLQIKMLTNELDGLVDSMVGGPWRATYSLTLPEQPELLRLGNSQARRAVKKAAKLGVQVGPAETERELRAWYELYLDNMRWLFVPPRPYRFCEVAWRRLQPHGLMRLLLAKHYEADRPRVVGGILLFMFGQDVSYAFSGWKREDQALRPNDALHWRAIQDACAEGFRHYDFGEVPKNNSGLAEFKSKWGAEEKSLYRYYYPAAHESEIGILESTGRMHKLASATWRRLPIKATVLLSNLAHYFF